MKKQHSIILLCLLLTLFSTASYAWRTDWKAKADQMIVVSPQVKAQIAKSPDKAKLNKVVKVGQAFMKEELSGGAAGYEDGEQDAYWKNVLSPLITMTKEEFFSPEQGSHAKVFITDYQEGYWICNRFSLDTVEQNEQGYVLMYHSIIAAKTNEKRYGLGDITEAEIQSPPESGSIYWYQLYINHDHKVYDAKFLNGMGSGWIGYGLETAKHNLEGGYQNIPDSIDYKGRNIRQHEVDLYTKQVNFLTQASKACPKN